MRAVESSHVMAPDKHPMRAVQSSHRMRAVESSHVRHLISIREGGAEQSQG